jgi:hypothetical protein
MPTIRWGKTSWSTALRTTWIDLYDPIPVTLVHDTRAPALRVSDDASTSTDTTCHTRDGQKCNWIAHADNRNFICHISAGGAGLSGVKAMSMRRARGVTVNGASCQHPAHQHGHGPGRRGYQLIFQVAWAGSSLAAGSTAINYCPSGLDKLSHCQYDSQLTGNGSTGRFVYSVDNEVAGDTDCAQLRANYNDKDVECTTSHE